MLAIRLKRMGNKHRPFYRIVVSENDKRPRARAVEELGYYHPVAPGKPVQIDTERAQYWISKGARPSDTVAGILRKQGVKA